MVGCKVNVPSLTEETRKGFCKDVDKMAEEAKVLVRNARRDVNEKIKKKIKFIYSNMNLMKMRTITTMNTTQ